MIENIDHNIGRVLQYLESSGKKKDTLVIFFSDNGANGFEMDSYPGTDEAWWNTISITGSPTGANAGHASHRAQGGRKPVRRLFISSRTSRRRDSLTVDGVAHVMDLATNFLELAGATYPAAYNGKPVKQPPGKSMVPLLS